MGVEVRDIINVKSGRFAFGSIFATGSCVICIMVYHNLKAGVFFAILFTVTGAINIRDKVIPKHYLTLVYSIWLIITSFMTLSLSQLCLNEALPENGGFVIVLGMLQIMAFFSMSYVITLRIRSTSIIVSAALMIFTCIDYFVFVFRGNEITPYDVLSIGTARNVAAEYSFYIPPTMYYSLTLCVVYYFASYALPPHRINKKTVTRIISCIFAVMCAAGMWIGGLNVKPLHWLQTGSVANGFLLNFSLLLRECIPQKPNDYSSDTVDQIANIYFEKEKSNRRMPDIIVIMDESFANIEVLGSELKTDVAVTPFIDTLHDNTVRGYALSSVFGGGTPNSEYEFLTGNSLLFLPAGSIAYQQFINQSTYSIAQDLKNRGYSAIAMHPYLSNSWKRDEIWPLLGFDECLFLDDFPKKDVLRSWITDQEMFETLISVYEDHRQCSDFPMFIFGVTIQNHGGYNYSGNDFNPTIHLEGYSQSYPDVEQYLTCLHETDKAVQGLIEYFRGVDHDVVVMLYGDHFPKLNDAFYEEVHGGLFESLNEQMLKYEVPFFIWTNYDSSFETIELISINYLSGLLYQSAGLKLPPYCRYLENLRKEIPACNALGYYSITNGGFLEFEEAQTKEREALQEYNWLEWNSVFDNNRNSVFFSSN